MGYLPKPSPSHGFSTPTHSSLGHTSFPFLAAETTPFYPSSPHPESSNLGADDLGDEDAKQFHKHEGASVSVSGFHPFLLESESVSTDSLPEARRHFLRPDSAQQDNMFPSVTPASQERKVRSIEHVAELDDLFDQDTLKGLPQRTVATVTVTRSTRQSP